MDGHGRGKAGSSSRDAARSTGSLPEVARTDGVYLRDLDPITSLRVQTENTLYEITVLRPPRSVVLVRGGRFFPKTTEASFGGSSFGGSCLKLAWFGVGLHMEFHFAGGWIITSRVRSIEVLDASSPPRSVLAKLRPRVRPKMGSYSCAGPNTARTRSAPHR